MRSARKTNLLDRYMARKMQPQEKHFVRLLQTNGRMETEVLRRIRMDKTGRRSAGECRVNVSSVYVFVFSLHS